MSATVRPAAVAGMFYPGQAQALSRLVAEQLAQAPARVGTPATPKMLLVPHAGFVYSGPIAARAYALLAGARDRIRRVVLLGPAHRVAVRGLAAPTSAAFETPLGRVPVDRAALDRLADLPQVVASDAAHEQEHSLEVQLPFLQSVLAAGFTLVPLVVGRASADEVAEVIERLWGDDETLILISSDLSHYLSYADARAIDRATIDRVLALDGTIGHDQACGATPLRGALRVAGRRGLVATLLDLRNSGDTAGDRRRVVGYAAVAFAPERDAAGTQAGSDGAATGGADRGAPARGKAGAADAPPAEASLGPALLTRAHNAIAKVFGQVTLLEPHHPAIVEKGATFVTLTRGGALRGCIGTLEARRALDADVRQHALAAAFRDPRFDPLGVHEWPGLTIEVSVLEVPQPIDAAADEPTVLAQLRPHVDGVIFDWRGRRATFLPQVWEQLGEPRAFLAALKRKAGLPAEFWAADVSISRYGVRKFVAPPIGAR